MFTRFWNVSLLTNRTHRDQRCAIEESRTMHSVVSGRTVLTRFRFFGDRFVVGYGSLASALSEVTRDDISHPPAVEQTVRRSGPSRR